MPDVTDGRLPHISTVIGNAILFEPKPVWELPMDFAASLVNDVLSRLFALLGGNARSITCWLAGSPC